MYNPVKPSHCVAMAGHSPILLNSITDADEEARARVVVCASHGGLYPAYLASVAGVGAVIFNDAGGGLDNAGVAGVLALAAVGIAAGAVSHESCRIADAQDMARRGRISVVNTLARKLGVVVGEGVEQASARLAGAGPPTGALANIAEARRVIRREPIKRDIVLADSASLVKPEDGGRIVITGSHGGLIGADPARALKADALLAVFNDAGGGCDNAGLMRLAALDARAIAAVTLAHVSARIGDANSAFHSGIVSGVNGRASRMGIAKGDRLRSALENL